VIQLPRIVRVGELLAQRVEAALANGQSETAMTLAGQVLAVADQLQANSQEGIISTMVAGPLTVSILRALPPDTEIDTRGTTAATRLAEAEADRSVHRIVTTINQLMPALGLTETQTFLEIQETEGLRAAVAWAEKLPEVKAQLSR
jgi:hypothetical protein